MAKRITLWKDGYSKEIWDSELDKFLSLGYTLSEEKKSTKKKKKVEEKTKENEKKFSHVANSLGLGTTFTLSPDDLNARVNLDFKKNPRSRNISGNVDIPITDDTRVNIAAQRNLIEGGQDSTAYGAGVNTKVFDGVGSLGFNLRRNPRETYGGVKFTMPLN